MRSSTSSVMRELEDSGARCWAESQRKRQWTFVRETLEKGDDRWTSLAMTFVAPGIQAPGRPRKKSVEDIVAFLNATMGFSESQGGWTTFLSELPDWRAYTDMFAKSEWRV